MSNILPEVILRIIIDYAYDTIKNLKFLQSIPLTVNPTYIYVDSNIHLYINEPTGDAKHIILNKSEEKIPGYILSVNQKDIVHVKGGFIYFNNQIIDRDSDYKLLEIFKTEIGIVKVFPKEIKLAGNTYQEGWFHEFNKSIKKGNTLYHHKNNFNGGHILLDNNGTINTFSRVKEFKGLFDIWRNNIIYMKHGRLYTSIDNKEYDWPGYECDKKNRNRVQETQQDIKCSTFCTKDDKLYVVHNKKIKIYQINAIPKQPNKLPFIIGGIVLTAIIYFLKKRS